MLVPIHEIKVKPGRRDVAWERLSVLEQSMAELGLLHPILIDQDKNLIAGLHRLEAAKRLKWTEIECNVRDFAKLQAEIAEIDENIVRVALSPTEMCDLFLYRKELYEALHPETKAGAAQAAGMNRAVGNNVDCKMQTTSPSFVRDTAEKLGVHPSTVARQVQIAKNLTPKAKEILRENTSVSKSELLKLSRLEPGQQEEAAAMLASHTIQSVGEYTQNQREPEEETTPDAQAAAIFMESFTRFSQNVLIGIREYGPAYGGTFALLSPEQISEVQQQADDLCAAIRELLERIRGEEDS